MDLPEAIRQGSLLSIPAVDMFYSGMECLRMDPKTIRRAEIPYACALGAAALAFYGREWMDAREENPSQIIDGLVEVWPFLLSMRFSIADMNDKGEKTREEIADWVEERLRARGQ